MNVRFSPRVPIACLSAMLLADTALALEFHGYVRAGTGGNSEGGDQVCFAMPGAGFPGKFRLGNECEHYAEIALSQEVYKDEDDGGYFKLHFRLAYQAEFHEDFESLTRVDVDFDNESFGDNDNEIASREFWIDGGNLVGGVFEGANFWVGKRFYRRHDIHITDFYPWDMSGVGGGIENIDLGLGKFHFAFFSNATDNSDIKDDDEAVSRFDFRVSDIQTNPGGNLTVGFDYRDWREDAGDFDPENGWMVTFLHFQDKLFGFNGFNKLWLQYGEDAASSLASWSRTTDGKTWRISDMWVFEPTPDWAGSLVFTYQNIWDLPNADDSHWIEAGGRVKYHFTDHVAVAVEAGREWVDLEGDGEDARKLDKITVAPLLTTGRGFWARPELRLFATYANWNSEARDAGVAGGVDGVFGDDTDGWTWGVQAEAWW